MSNNKTQMSQAQYDELQREFAVLQAKFNVIMTESEGIKSREYTTTKEARENSLAILANQIKHVADKLERAEIVLVEPKEGIVNFDDEVVIALTINGYRNVISKTLVANITDPTSQMSYESPIAQAIVGQPVGSIQSCILPAGACTVEILDAHKKEEARGR